MTLEGALERYTLTVYFAKSYININTVGRHDFGSYWIVYHESKCRTLHSSRSACSHTPRISRFNCSLDKDTWDVWNWYLICHCLALAHIKAHAVGFVLLIRRILFQSMCRTLHLEALRNHLLFLGKEQSCSNIGPFRELEGQGACCHEVISVGKHRSGWFICRI